MRRPGEVLTRRSSSSTCGTSRYEATPTSSTSTSATCARRSTGRSARDDRDGPRQRLPAARGRAPVTLSIRARLALVCAVLVGAMVVGARGDRYLRLEADLRAAADDGLVTRADELVNQPVTGDTIDIGPSDVGDIFAQVVAADGRVDRHDARSRGRCLPAPPISRSSTGTPSARPSSRPAASRCCRACSPRASRTARSSSSALPSTTSARRSIGCLACSSWSPRSPPALAALVGWVVAASGAATRRADASRVRGDLRLRAEPAARRAGDPGRAGQLGASLNRMLDRLQAALQRERRFVDDASHELRTPLANLKVELELALRRSRTPDELEAALRSAAVETDRLTSLAEDLLVLARAADGRLPIRREESSWVRWSSDVARRFAGRAEARGIALATTSVRDGTARVDDARIRQALGNLIENAMIHTPPGGRITVGLTRVRRVGLDRRRGHRRGVPPGLPRPRLRAVQPRRRRALAGPRRDRPRPRDRPGRRRGSRRDPSRPGTTRVAARRSS